MALKTLGTAATTTLSAIQWNSVYNVSDLAALNALIKQQTSQGQKGSTTIFPAPTINQGGLFVPARGHWRLLEGDWLGVDPVTGDVILITAASAAGASWVHT